MDAFLRLESDGQGLSRRLSRPDHFQGSAILENDQNVESGIFKNPRSLKMIKMLILAHFRNEKPVTTFFRKCAGGKSLTIAIQARFCYHENNALP